MERVIGLGGLCLGVLVGIAGCTAEEGSSSSSAVGVELPCDDALDDVMGDPGQLPGEKGTILRCAVDKQISREQIQQALDGLGYRGKPMVTGAKVYRVLYVTERGNGAPGYSSASVFVPDHPLAEELPVVVASHGARGQAPRCAPSLLDPSLESLNGDHTLLVYPMVGAGYAVIAPDLAGYANFGAPGNPPSAFDSFRDVGQSTLDGARALRELIPSRLSDKVVLTGFSQGGHTALSALALAESYGAGGELAAVVTFAPLWLSQRTWGALLVVADQFPIHEAPVPNSVSIWYHYTHAELLDGPGQGMTLFAEDKREEIRKFVEQSCWEPPYAALEELGETAVDLYDPLFASSVATSAALGTDCPAEGPTAELCQKWISRYLEDRPHLTGSAAAVPQLLAYGGQDVTMEPGRFQCVLDRLQEDEANLSYCYDPNAGHSGVLASTSDFVAEWVAHQTMGTPLEAKCPAAEIRLTNDQGRPLACTVPPIND